MSEVWDKINIRKLLRHQFTQKKEESHHNSKHPEPQNNLVADVAKVFVARVAFGSFSFGFVVSAKVVSINKVAVAASFGMCRLISVCRKKMYEIM